MRTTRPAELIRSIAVCVAAGLLAAGCQMFHHKAAPSAPVKKAAPAVVQMMSLDLTKVQPNESGQVPILEYHDLVTTSKVTGYQYPAAAFRKDLDWLYAHNYRPISLSDYVQGKIDCPPGKSPVILTFDDALRGQFNYTADGKIDSNCAVGILDAFHAQHPDWPLKGTFFVLTDEDPKLPPPFYQAGLSQGKMEYLVKEGFEIGNHTVHHRLGMRRWPDTQVEAEFAGAVSGIHKYLPTYTVQTLALPFGVYPKNMKLVMSGQSGGVTYHNICALQAGAAPAPSPMAKTFKPYRLPRIIPGNENFALRFWLDYLETHKAEKFVSDGDPNTYTVNIVSKGRLDAAKLQKDHFFLRTYQGTQLIAGK